MVIVQRRRVATGRSTGRHLFLPRSIVEGVDPLTGTRNHSHHRCCCYSSNQQRRAAHSSLLVAPSNERRGICGRRCVLGLRPRPRSYDTSSDAAASTLVVFGIAAVASRIAPAVLLLLLLLLLLTGHSCCLFGRMHCYCLSSRRVETGTKVVLLPMMMTGMLLRVCVHANDVSCCAARHARTDCPRHSEGQ